jgi:hypothetical protein
MQDGNAPETACAGLSCRRYTVRTAMWLGDKRGYLTDWTTQLWVKLTGKRIDLDVYPWLKGPIGKPEGIGSDFFHQLAREQNLSVEEGRGLIEDFKQLASERCDTEKVSPLVKEFYENTGCYELEAWSEWCGWFKPFGWVLATVFSRRLQQLNVPLSNLDTSRGMTSNVISVVDPRTGKNYCTAWVRELLSNKSVVYAGSYSVCTLPGVSGACVKVVFPLPNGNAIVVMYAESLPDGSFSITSSGHGFGEPGFYFTVCTDEGVWAKYVRAMRENIRVYPSGRSDVRADHILKIWGMTFLRLHYKLSRVRGDETVKRTSLQAESEVR